MVQATLVKVGRAVINKDGTGKRTYSLNNGTVIKHYKRHDDHALNIDGRYVILSHEYEVERFLKDYNVEYVPINS
jgi:hypothetical protein